MKSEIEALGSNVPVGLNLSELAPALSPAYLFKFLVLKNKALKNF